VPFCLRAIYHDCVVEPIAQHMHRCGRVLRRRDLIGAGFTDHEIRSALRTRRIFRVRHGWFALPDTSDLIVQVIRVGGRLTGLAALRNLGLFLPAPKVMDIAVPRSAANLRQPNDRRARLRPSAGVRINWVDSPRRERSSSNWLATADEALLVVLRRESREIAVACCDALLNSRTLTQKRLDTVFADAPARVHSWRRCVDGRAEAWGETAARLRLTDAGIPFEPQVTVGGRRYDGRVSPGVFLEIDGMQHSEDWVGAVTSTFESDHDRDILTTIEGARTIRVTYRQLESWWEPCLEAIRVAWAIDVGGRRS
jgi:very-short-patch-repair endonuclease